MNDKTCRREDAEFNELLIARIKSYWASLGYEPPLMHQEMVTAVNPKTGAKVTALTIRSDMQDGFPRAIAHLKAA